MQKKQMSSIKRRKYDQNFKQEVLKMTDNQIVREVSKRMGIGENLLYKWRNERESSLPAVEKAANSEIDELKKQLK
jgi:transposase-like protein